MGPAPISRCCRAVCGVRTVATQRLLDYANILRLYALTVPGEARSYSWCGVVTNVAQLAAVYGRTAVYKIGILYMGQ